MSIIQPLHCLTAMLIGLHFVKERFVIANYFNEILDSVSELPDFRALSINSHELVFRLATIKVTLNPNAFLINSRLAIGKDLFEHLPRRLGDEGVESIILPRNAYDRRIDLDITNQRIKVDPKAFRKDFLQECVEIIRLVDKIVHTGLFPFRFIGIVQYYAIPLKSVHWDVLERFTEQAEIPGGINTEKTAINRYYFPAEEDKDEQCLIFRLVKPDDHKTPDDSVAGANFDFQHIPEHAKTIAEYGGAKQMVNLLAVGIQEIIDRSKFLKFKGKE